MSLYDDLGIPPDADTATIVRAWRKAAKYSHPDKGGKAEDFQRVQRAYAVLSDPARRERYDSTGQEAEAPDIIAQARIQLVQMFTALISQYDPDTTDFIGLMKQKVLEGQQAGREALRRDEQVLKKLEKARKRLGTKGSQDFLRVALEAQTQQVRARIEHGKFMCDLGNEMMKLLGDYSYSFDEAPTYSFDNTFFTTSTWRP